jgi:hypothetical protein
LHLGMRGNFRILQQVLGTAVAANRLHALNI